MTSTEHFGRVKLPRLSELRSVGRLRLLLGSLAVSQIQPPSPSLQRVKQFKVALEFSSPRVFPLVPSPTMSYPSAGSHHPRLRMSASQEADVLVHGGTDWWGYSPACPLPAPSFRPPSTPGGSVQKHQALVLVSGEPAQCWLERLSPGHMLAKSTGLSMGITFFHPPRSEET